MGARDEEELKRTGEDSEGITDEEEVVVEVEEEEERRGTTWILCVFSRSNLLHKLRTFF
jgi:hypothetical protein